MKCPYCGSEIEAGSNYCFFCGNKIEQKEIYEEDLILDENADIYHPNTKAKFKYHSNKNKIAWVGLIIICLVIAFFKLDFNHINPIEDTDYKYNYKEINGEYFNSDKITKISHLLKGGEVVTDDEYIYMINDNAQIIQMEAGFKNQRILYNGNCSYLQIEGQYLYFKDDDIGGYVVKYDLQNNTYETIIETDVYYLFVTEQFAFYQCDIDNESIYSYNLETKENIKINDEASYNIQIVDNVIYYSTALTVEKIDLNSGNKTTVLNELVYNFICDKDILYYISDEDGCIYSYDLNNETTTRLNRELTFEMVVLNDEIYYINRNKEIINMKKDGTDNQWVNLDVKASSIYVLHDYIVYYDLNEDDWYVMDINGEQIKPVFNNSKNSQYV